ncbi:MAG: TIGR01841 family phasin [Alphaproteobacteria bacterium]|nr:TIGR01841 family phasin [Alphaproteobacteria bacterium]
MANANPYGTFDFTKFMADFKVPAFDVDKIMAAQKKNIDTLTSANKLAAEAAQSLFERQAAIIRENVEELTAATQELLATGEPKDKVARHAEMTREGVERAVANLKELNEAVAKTNGAVFEILNKRFVEGLEEVQGLVKNGKK